MLDKARTEIGERGQPHNGDTVEAETALGPTPETRCHRIAAFEDSACARQNAISTASEGIGSHQIISFSANATTVYQIGLIGKNLQRQLTCRSHAANRSRAPDSKVQHVGGRTTFIARLSRDLSRCNGT